MWQSLSVLSSGSHTNMRQHQAMKGSDSQFGLMLKEKCLWFRRMLFFVRRVGINRLILRLKWHINEA